MKSIFLNAKLLTGMSLLSEVWLHTQSTFAGNVYVKTEVIIVYAIYQW